ncbi:nuclear transport factor 2 family protein [Vibrio hannami]|uniref:nuclear transport factor 2 family protein n=1 Tax=Vibrio hannami TaxID=2717094 RepID=UPI00240F29B5|nr:nuclear transport factor 2 family protein [Vibrio hannami]MDG3087668.1 nuclear transport factor 2 family protein [Vibrio hannami]
MNVEQVASFYKSLTADGLSELYEIYHTDVEFRDPLHCIEGIDSLYNYFDNLYKNVENCSFYISYSQQQSSVGFLVWEMSLKHPKINKGKAVTVHGCSHLEFFEGKVLYHRDYFDAGEMLYENLPVVGTFISAIKQRVGQ